MELQDKKSLGYVGWNLYRNMSAKLILVIHLLNTSILEVGWTAIIATKYIAIILSKKLQFYTVRNVLKVKGPAVGPPIL